MDAQTSSAPLPPLDLPPIPDPTPHPWNDINEKQLRSALIGACKRMHRNAEAHFHLGLMYMRKSDGDEALRLFQHCKKIYEERLEHFRLKQLPPPQQLLVSIARAKSHIAQAAHLAASSSLKRQDRGGLLQTLQNDLVESTKLDFWQPDVWNALALLHLVEGGESGSRDLLRSIRCSFPDYLDALNNLGLAELALGNESVAMGCFQKVILCDRAHPEALSNYALILLQNGMYDAAIRAFETAVEGSHSHGRGLSFAWSGLAVARCAVGLLEEGLEAAREAERMAERMADSAAKAKFSMLVTSIHARVVTEKIRRGVALPITRALRNSETKRADHKQVDSAVLKLRALARDIQSSSAYTALGAVLRLRHSFSGEETGNRNFGAEAAERLVEALEKDDMDATAWVQLSLLQMGTGEFSSSREFAVQAVARDDTVEAAWNSMAVSCQLNDERSQAERCYQKAIEVTRKKYDRKRSRFSKSREGEDASGKEVPKENRRSDRNNSQSEKSSQIKQEGSDANKQLNKAGLKALAALYNNLGNLKRQQGGCYSEALAAYEKSIEIDSQNPAVYNNLALLYITVGRFENAQEMLDYALKLQPDFGCAISNRLKLNALVRRREQEQEQESEREKRGLNSRSDDDDDYDDDDSDSEEDNEDSEEGPA